MANRSLQWLCGTLGLDFRAAFAPYSALWKELREYPATVEIVLQAMQAAVDEAKQEAVKQTHLPVKVKAAHLNRSS